MKILTKSGKSRPMSKDLWGGHSMKNVLEKAHWEKEDGPEGFFFSHPFVSSANICLVSIEMIA